MKTISHTMLRRGDIIRSPSTKKSYIVIDVGEDEIMYTAIARYNKKSLSEVRNWDLVEEDDRRHCDD